MCLSTQLQRVLEGQWLGAKKAVTRGGVPKGNSLRNQSLSACRATHQSYFCVEPHNGHAEGSLQSCSPECSVGSPAWPS